MTALDRIDGGLTALGESLDWALAQLRPILPASVSGLGHRRTRRVVDLYGDGALSDRGVLSTSFLGEARATEVGSAKTHGLVAILQPEVQFTITTQLSAAAASAGRSAIALRLEKLCPIPVEDAVFAWERVSPPGSNPVTVEVSITRRATLDAARRSLDENGEPWTLAGGVSETGTPRFEFARNKRQPMGLGLKAIILSLLVGAAMVAWSGRLDEAATGAQLSQAEMSREARAAARVDAQLDTIARIHNANTQAPELGSWLATLSTLSESEDEFTSLQLSNAEVRLERDRRQIARAPVEPVSANGSGTQPGEAAP